MQERKLGAGRWSLLRSQASPWDGTWYGFLASLRKEFKSHSKVKDGLFRKIHTPQIKSGPSQRVRGPKIHGG